MTPKQKEHIKVSAWLILTPILFGMVCDHYNHVAWASFFAAMTGSSITSAWMNRPKKS